MSVAILLGTFTDSVQHLDPFLGAGKRHIFFGLMRVFCKRFLSIIAYFCLVALDVEYTAIAIALTLHALANFASPLAINRILT